MGRSKTPSYALTLKLDTTKSDDVALDKYFELSRKLYNALLGEGLKRFKLMRESKDNICKICGEKLELNNNNKQIKVFLGGTCNESNWRQELINKLDDKVVDYFNPVVEDWTPECMNEELKQRALCDYCLYVITPRMTGVYSIAEVIDDSNKRPNKTIFCYLSEDINFNQDLTDIKLEALKFTDGQKRSLDQVAKMVKNNGGKTFNSLEEIAEYLNAVGEIKKVLPRIGQDVIESIINLATVGCKNMNNEEQI